MARRIYVKFHTVPITRKGEKECEVIARVDLAGEIMRYDGRAYLPLLCNVTPLTVTRSFPLDDELVFWDCEVQKGQFYVSVRDANNFLRGGSKNSGRIIRVAVVKQRFLRRMEKRIAVSDNDEVGEFFEKKEETE